MKEETEYINCCDCVYFEEWESVCLLKDEVVDGSQDPCEDFEQEYFYKQLLTLLPTYIILNLQGAKNDQIKN